MASTPARKMVSTPIKSPATPNNVAATPKTESPGTWRHPRIEEITRRQQASTFTDSNVRRIAINLTFFIALIVLHSFSKGFLPTRRSSPLVWNSFRYTYYALLTLPIINIVMNLLPLIRAKDDLSDIALTPGQRKLLGLPPSSAPPTPGSVYSTPPRYSRAPSASGSVSSRRSFTSSPLANHSPSNQGTPTPAGNGNGNFNGSGSIQSPGHQLLQKAMFGARRSSLGSLGSPSPKDGLLGGSIFSSGPDTPSPSPAGKRSTVGLNSKWRYDKGMYERSSGFRDSLSGSMYT